eukprot:6204433-Pleurochrysis_carterae.AAC.2
MLKLFVTILRRRRGEWFHDSSSDNAGCRKATRACKCASSRLSCYRRPLSTSSSVHSCRCRRAGPYAEFPPAV